MMSYKRVADEMKRLLRLIGILSASAVLCIVSLPFGFHGCASGIAHRGDILSFPDLAQDEDGYDNIFFGIPIVKADTVLHRIGYSLGYSGRYKLALWVSYYSYRNWIESRQLTGRHWHADTSLTDKLRAELDDYYRSGYDRGHLAMQADMRGRSELCEREACYLSNAAPQQPQFNRGIWLELEEQIRDYVRENGDCWVITGPIFIDENYKSIGANKIAVPYAFYKILIDTVENGILARSFIIPNEPAMLPVDSFIVSIDSIENATGIDLFPELADDIENRLERHISCNHSLLQ